MALKADMAQGGGGSGNADAEIAALRSKVDELIQNRVAPAVAAVADQVQAGAQAAAQAASDTVRQQVTRLSDRVRAQPLTALGIAALAGFVLAALARR